jgi:hypothetical protein
MVPPSAEPRTERGKPLGQWLRQDIVRNSRYDEDIFLAVQSPVLARAGLAPALTFQALQTEAL